MVSPYSFICRKKYVRCPKCRHRSYKKTHEEFVEEALNKRGSEYKIIGDYITNMKPIEILHVPCGKSWSPPPVKFLAGRSCPHCVDRKISKGMKIIEEWLDKNKIQYKREVKFETCILKDHLPFDFYLEDYNLLIEYDGQMHFRAWNGNIEKLEITKLRDQTKTKWAEMNKINLLRIKYTDNLLEKLEEYFNINNV
jgi:very-short-patch-repair endonuclease